MDLNPNDLLKGLQNQRAAALDEAAKLYAQVEAYKRLVETQAAKIAELEKKLPAEGSGESC